ncbi:MAG: restriction endonuclease subunit R, partial [Treponema sp.]|nr:restriction endonuclease subunit R [Treponema sp.]
MGEAGIAQLQHEIAALENLLAEKRRQLETARTAYSKAVVPPGPEINEPVYAGDVQQVISDPGPNIPAVNNHSPPEAKIALFGFLFKGRDDLYAKRFENRKNGKSGYQPVCRNEWITGICEKTKKHRISCGSCSRRAFEPVTGEVIRNHLAGFAPAKN